MRNYSKRKSAIKSNPTFNGTMGTFVIGVEEAKSMSCSLKSFSSILGAHHSTSLKYFILSGKMELVEEWFHGGHLCPEKEAQAQAAHQQVWKIIPRMLSRITYPIHHVRPLPSGRILAFSMFFCHDDKFALRDISADKFKWISRIKQWCRKSMHWCNTYY